MTIYDGGGGSVKDFLLRLQREFGFVRLEGSKDAATVRNRMGQAAVGGKVEYNLGGLWRNFR